MELGNDATNFLLYSYFGMDPEKLKEKKDEEVINNCAKKAYLDLCRTLRFNDKDETKHQTFRDDICKLIEEKIYGLLQNMSNKKFDFDKEYYDILDYIQREGEKKKDVLKKTFTYGQAQKWLNMTMKYMWLLGLWENKFNNVLSALHVPVDSYIIEAACKENIFSKTKKPTSEYKSWSTWDRTQYEEFQDALHDASLSSNAEKITPIEWECSAWIRIAEERREKKSK